MHQAFRLVSWKSFARVFPSLRTSCLFWLAPLPCPLWASKSVRRIGGTFWRCRHELQFLRQRFTGDSPSLGAVLCKHWNSSLRSAFSAFLYLPGVHNLCNQTARSRQKLYSPLLWNANTMTFLWTRAEVAVFSCADGSVRRRQLRQKDSNDPIATSVMVCAAMSSDVMVNGYVRMVNRWFHAVSHRQNTENPSEKRALTHTHTYRHSSPLVSFAPSLSTNTLHHCC